MYIMESPPNMFYAYCNTATNITSGYTDIPWDINPVKTDGIVHSTSSNPAEITINREGYYNIIARITGETQTNNAAEIEARMQIDTGSGFATESGTLVRGSIIRYTNWSQTMTINIIKYFNAGDVVKIQGNLATGNTVYLLADASAISIIEIK